MKEDFSTPRADESEPMPALLNSVQPGGGVCYRIELAWGRARRWYLSRFRGRYVTRMRQLRQGSTEGAPHAILDPRDLKFCRNQCTCDWPLGEDPFAWRERIPLARWGLAEVVVMGGVLGVAIVLLAISPWPVVALLPAVLLAFVFYFFRDPPRQVPRQPGLLVAPADGKIAEVSPLEHDPFLDGPAVRIGIFLSVFNVHINRAPVRARVVRLKYHPGEFLNALDPESAIRNESLWIGLQSVEAPEFRYVVRQIAGLIARRIVCGLRVGEIVERGHKFGMIKLGSRTELILPRDEDCEICVSVGDRVRGGATILARWKNSQGEQHATAVANALNRKQGGTR